MFATLGQLVKLSPHHQQETKNIMRREYNGMRPKRKRVCRSGRVCCVDGCSNSEHRNQNLTFYSFPGRDYEVERKRRWIQAVRRTRKDESWMPNSNSRVCSIHFVGGKKSDIAAHPSYVPSIFDGTPSRENILKCETITGSTASPEVGASYVALVYEDFDQEDSPLMYVIDPSYQPKTVSIGCQAENWTNDDQRLPNTLFCWTGQNEASTQSNIFLERTPQANTGQEIKKENVADETDMEMNPGFFGVKSITSDETMRNTFLEPKPQANTGQKIKKENVADETDMEMNPGFFGVAGITSNETMRNLAGMSQVAFHSFVQIIEPCKYGQPTYYKKVSKENRLLLFFMKINLNLDFAALGAFFCIDHLTASKIFIQVLETVVELTKTWIFWPPRESVRKNLPSSLHNYPTCRCIVDCIEIPIEAPSTVEQRILMYSNHNGGFTTKFLIAITPDGSICKISKGYGGRATDSFIINDCGFLNLIEKGDLVLADKRFPQIKSELAKRSCTLVTPPFAINPQFSAEEVDEGYKSASVEIHVERAIQRVRLSGILKHISADLLPYTDAIMHVCCVIANVQPPLVNDGD